MNVADYRNKVLRLQGSKDLMAEQLAKQVATRDAQRARMVACEEALVFVQEVAQRTQEQLTIHIEDVVNTALDTCFPGEYQFQLRFEIKRNKTEARLVFLKNGYEIEPMDASGGGVVDVASFALRIAAWSLGKTRNTICLDEPMKFLSRDLQPRAGEILSEISKKLGIQFIMVSHVADIIQSADRVFEIGLNNKGVSQVKRQDA
jgi:DNA repair exonuclease SbcCD ATPase subunit